MPRSAGLWILLGIFTFWGVANVFIALGAGAFAGMVDLSTLPILDQMNVDEAMVLGGVSAVGVAFLILGILALVTAWGIWNVRGWAWGLGVALAIVGLLIFPVGTLLGIVTLVYLAAVRPTFRGYERYEEREERPGPAT